MNKNNWGKHCVRKIILPLLMMAGGIEFACAEGEAKTYELRIQGGRLLDAVKAVRAQTDAEFFYSYELVDEDGINPVDGRYTLDEALAKMFEGTGLSGSLTESGMIVITRENSANAQHREEDMASGKLKKGLLASVAAFVFGAGANAQEVETIDEREKAQEEKEEKDVIVVTGTNIRGVYPEAAPLDVYTAEDIALSGATTLERFLETLPQNVNNLGAVTAALGPGEGSNFSRGGGVDLRGLGVGTTLVLLNGRRLTSPDGESPDTSLIPLGAVERVEVLTDGASAIYGSDAIAGVVNFILRDDFDGVDTAVSYGGATRGGHDRIQANLAAGTSWGSGAGFISYSYSTQSALAAGERDFASSAPPSATLAPNELKHSVFGAVNQDITSRLRAYGNAFYSTRDSDINTTSALFEVVTDADQSQIFLTGGLEYEASDDLFFQLDVTYVNYELTSLFNNQTLGAQSLTDEQGDSLDILSKVDGTLFDLPGGEAKFALGGGYSAQDFDAGFSSIGDPLEITLFDRESYFGFAEVFAPVIGEEQDIAGIRRLELNAAVRYTDYSDFGGAWTPRAGLLWSPLDGLNLRGTYARAFRAPTLRELNPNRGSANVFPIALFGFPDTFSSDNSSVLLYWLGSLREGLKPEFSDTWTFGFDFEPEYVPRLKISATYFNIDYTDRLGTVDLFSALRDQEGFGFAFNSSPSLSDFGSIVENVDPITFFDLTGMIADVSDPAAIGDVVTVIFDGRADNLASSRSEGIDVAVDYGHESAFGELNYGVRLTHTIASTQRAVAVAPEESLVDTLGNPVSLRLRGYLGVRRGGFSGQVNVNYLDSYMNTTVDPVEPIDSWTTVDLSLRYDFSDMNSSLLQGATVSVSVNNMFDADPPFVSRRTVSGSDGLLRGGGFDPVNANAVGRFITFGLTKKF